MHSLVVEDPNEESLRNDYEADPKNQQNLSTMF